ncbi:MAG: 16S rRNA (guanine(527)-N(7))-methyltransferase RsmG [Ruminococcus sp.]|nr:16S rRNA (guanine(527)-N(7))-methyltransferase RsmG [Ruminococcus sp.]
MKTLVKTACKKIGIDLSEEQALKFENYYKQLIEWNEKINLTRIIDPDEVSLKHFADSLTILKYCDIPENAAVIDVGTGAGFPGVPLKIYRPDINLTLLDSLNKRLNFLNTVSEQNKLSVKTLHSRAEEAGRLKPERERYDIAVSRAVARLNTLCEYCLPFIKVGGSFVAMKGPNLTEELSEAKSAIKILGGEVKSVNEFNLDTAGERTVVVIKKIKPTPNTYPRHGSKIKNKPL